MSSRVFFFLFLYCLTGPGVTNAQIRQPLADSLWFAGQKQAAFAQYRKVLAEHPEYSTNLYNYCCALSRDKQLDSCFKNLYLLTTIDNSLSVLTDADFINARADKRWPAFEKQVVALYEKKSGKPINDLQYAKALWSLYASDQAYYSDIDFARKREGPNSAEVKRLWDIKRKLNDANQIELEHLIQSKGWPKKTQVGGDAASAAFLVIQHADSARQRKYLPVIEQLCKEGEASWEAYALMYDRLQMSMKLPQKYGSQITTNKATGKYELWPLIDQSKVSEWRAAAGMEPLSDYLMNWGLKPPAGVR